MQEVRRFLNSLINLLLVNSQFYAISNPLKGIISPFPHGTCALSIKKSYLRLRGWSPYVQTDVSPPYWFGVTKRSITPWLQGFHLLWQPFLGFSRICLTLLVFILLSFATTRKNSVDLFP